MLDKIFGMMKGDGKSSPSAFSLEDDFIKPFESLPGKFTEDEYRYITMLMSNDEDISDSLQDSDSAKAYLSLIGGRAAIYNYKLSGATCAILMLKYKSNLAIYTMVLSYIAYVLKNKRPEGFTGDTVDIYEFYKIFEKGFPDEDDLQKVWNKQKYYNGNMLDTDNVVISLRTELM